MNQQQITSQNLFKAYIQPELEKGKVAVYGEIREWDGVKYQKGNKEWKRVTETPSHSSGPFNEKDLESIEIYSEIGSRILNGDLRKGISHHEEEKALNTALNKLPDYVGTVYRYEDNREGFEKHLEEIQKGNIQLRPEFLSTSKKTKNQLFDFGKDYNMLYYEIESKTGKDIEKLSNTGNEYEVLFPSRSAFEITSVKINKVKNSKLILNLVIKMREI